jgi:hypothetical protein
MLCSKSVERSCELINCATMTNSIRWSRNGGHGPPRIGSSSSRCRREPNSGTTEHPTFYAPLESTPSSGKLGDKVRAVLRTLSIANMRPTEDFRHAARRTRGQIGQDRQWVARVHAVNIADGVEIATRLFTVMALHASTGNGMRSSRAESEERGHRRSRLSLAGRSYRRLVRR